jgi:hypothetical protein
VAGIAAVGARTAEKIPKGSMRASSRAKRFMKRVVSRSRRRDERQFVERGDDPDALLLARYTRGWCW